MYFEAISDSMQLKDKFSSPFIEERLYFISWLTLNSLLLLVLVPFYRGAVVFLRSLATLRSMATLFSSPFIEERLYFLNQTELIFFLNTCSRPLLSRSGCILFNHTHLITYYRKSSRPLLSRSGCIYNFETDSITLVWGSRPFLSRSGCI